MRRHTYVEMLISRRVAFWTVERPGYGRVELDMLASCSRIIGGLGGADFEVSVVLTVEASVPKMTAIIKRSIGGILVCSGDMCISMAQTKDWLSGKKGVTSISSFLNGYSVGVPFVALPPTMRRCDGRSDMRRDICRHSRR